MIALLAIPAGILLGFGVCAHLAYTDTRRGIHPSSMGGPKMQAPLLKRYRLLALLGLLGWFAVALTDNGWFSFGFGLVGALIGRVAFNALDRRMTQHMG